MFYSFVAAQVSWFLTLKKGPFQGAIALTFFALLMVLSWNENYGESNNHKDSSIYEQFSLGWNTTLRNSTIWKIGLTQALSEGAMYTVSGFTIVCYDIHASISYIGNYSLFSCGYQLFFLLTPLVGSLQAASSPP